MSRDGLPQSVGEECGVEKESDTEGECWGIEDGGGKRGDAEREVFGVQKEEVDDDEEEEVEGRELRINGQS